MSTKSPECWATDPQARALRVEVSGDRSLLLPHNEFLLSELVTNGGKQTLRLVFATHEITVTGHSLRRIETAMQRMELSLLTALTGKQPLLVPDGQPVVLEIEVAEVKDKD